MSATERDRLRIEAATLRTRALRMRAAGNADDRWEAVCMLRDAAHKEIASLGHVDDPQRHAEIEARVEACSAFLLAKDPLRALDQWARIPAEAFSSDSGAVLAGSVKPLLGAGMAELATAWRDVLGDTDPPAAA